MAHYPVILEHDSLEDVAIQSSYHRTLFIHVQTILSRHILNGFEKWKKWATTHKVPYLPANSITFSLFILSLIQSNNTTAVIVVTFYSVKFLHKTLAMADPTLHPLPLEMLEVARRISIKKPSQWKEPFTQVSCLFDDRPVHFVKPTNLYYDVIGFPWLPAFFGISWNPLWRCCIPRYLFTALHRVF